MYSTDMLVYAQEHCGWNALCKSFFSENIHKCNNDSTIMVCECVCVCNGKLLNSYNVKFMNSWPHMVS